MLVLEKAPAKDRGGNSRFTGGIVRFAHQGLEDILPLVPELTELCRDAVSRTTSRDTKSARPNIISWRPSEEWIRTSYYSKSPNHHYENEFLDKNVKMPPINPPKLY